MVSPEFELEYPHGPYISRNLTEQMLQQFQARLEMKVRSTGSGWVWYRLPSFRDGSLNIGLELGFYNGMLRQLTVFHDGTDVHGTDWSHWSEEKERLNVRKIRSWFEAKGFQVGKHPWGEIWASYDVRSGSGDGGVRWTNRQSEEQPVIGRALDFFTLYIVLALLCALLKVATPLFHDDSWATVLLWMPAGATGVAWLHGYLVARIMKRRRP